MKRALKKLNYRLISESRRKKLDLFWEVMSPFPGAVVLNLGAAPPHLNQVLLGTGSAELLEQPEQDPRWRALRVIGTNIDEGNVREYVRLYSTMGFAGIVLDGCCLPFEDQSVDIVFSNAVIEHVTPDMQRKMANEIMRVGRSWFITTPNFWYPIELHNRLPFVQFLPTKCRLLIQRKLQTWPEAEPLHLLSARNLANLFPGSEIRKMRVTFYPETLIAYSASRERGPVVAGEGTTSPARKILAR